MEEQYPLDRRSPILFPPNVVGKEITIRATVSKGDEALEGVIVAQGGKANGYSLYIQNNALIWLVKQGGQSYQVNAGNLPQEQFTIEASLLQDGHMNLKINGNTVGRGKAPALFTSSIIPEQMRISYDNMGENNVGDYEGNFWLRGRMRSNSYIALRDPALSDTEGVASEEKTTEKTDSEAGSIVVKIGVIPHEMKYDKVSFTVKAGQQVTIDFENQDFMQHNLLVAQKGTLEKVGNAADELARDPKGIEQHFIPDMPEIIAATRLVDPEGRESIVFTAPSEPGDYPYICTVPGHWRIMNGIMTVE